MINGRQKPPHQRIEHSHVPQPRVVLRVTYIQTGFAAGQVAQIAHHFVRVDLVVDAHQPSGVKAFDEAEVLGDARKVFTALFLFDFHQGLVVGEGYHLGGNMDQIDFV